jgi:hypothetical protein
MPPPLPLDNIHGYLHRIGVLIWAFGGERIEHIRKTNNSSDQRNILTGKALRISATTPLLMVGDGNLLCNL